jgi:ComF family protein
MRTALGSMLLEAAAALLAPPTCAACDAPVPPRTAFCPPCAATLVRATETSPGHVAAFVYGGAIAATLRRFKFDARPDLARALVAGLQREEGALAALSIDVVVPVPLHPSRLVERGYNQAALLAGPLARSLDAPFRPRALARTVPTQRQTDLSRDLRAANLEAAMIVRQPSSIEGKVVLVVDDVETTGATLRACQKALERRGARRVCTAVVARAERSCGETNTGEGSALSSLVESSLCESRAARSAARPQGGR